MVAPRPRRDGAREGPDFAAVSVRYWSAYLTDDEPPELAFYCPSAPGGGRSAQVFAAALRPMNTSPTAQFLSKCSRHIFALPLYK